MCYATGRVGLWGEAVGVRMSKERRECVGLGPLRRAVPVLTLLAASLPPAARAQVNIDQDKSPAHIYASDCAVCHKATRGLANGRSRTALTAYLAEHYTSSNSEAAALAAYVLSGGGGVGAPAAVHDASGAAGRPRAATAAPPAQAGRVANQAPGRERAGARRQARQRTRSAPPPEPASGPQAPPPKPAAATAGPAMAPKPAATSATADAPAAKPASGRPAVSAPAAATPSEAPSGSGDNIAD